MILPSDILVYSQVLGGTISHYYDANDLEVDSVLYLNNWKYALIEVKPGNKNINEEAKKLLKVKELIKLKNLDKDKLPIKKQDLLEIITGGLIAYEVDAVKIIPIDCLKD